MSPLRLASRLRLLTRLRSEYRALHRRIASLENDLTEVRADLPTLVDFPLTPAGQLVVAAQRAVTEHAPPDAYTDLYRAEETLYWLRLPAWILEWSERAAPQRMIDIGSGYGALAVFADMATPATITCVDIDPGRITTALAASHALVVVKANVEIADVPNPPYDGVVMTEVIEHFNFAPVPTMRRIHDAMTPGGRLFLSTPDADSWGRVPDSYSDWRDMPPADPAVTTEDRHIYQFTAEELTEVLTESGFTILRMNRSPGRWGFHLNVEAGRS
ncbi:MAG: class I SAM-dependent methyltransferase [Acidimicrobiia bacterium]